MTTLPRGYDEWRTRSPDDQYAMDYPEEFRRGVYTVTVVRMIEAKVDIEVEASSVADAMADALSQAKGIPFDKWTLDQDDMDTPDVEGPPERDPDAAREDRDDDR